MMTSVNDIDYRHIGTGALWVYRKVSLCDSKTDES